MPGIVVARAADQGGPQRRSAATHSPREQPAPTLRWAPLWLAGTPSR